MDLKDKKATDFCCDLGLYPGVFPKDYGLGVKFRSNGIDYTSIAPEWYGKVFFTIYRNYDLPRFYYGTFCTQNLYYSFTEDGVEETRALLDVPEVCEEIRIELNRPLTEKDLENEYWKTFYLNDPVSAFNSREDLVKVGEFVFKERFPEGWELVISDD
jgi:hypothetical protein